MRTAQRFATSAHQRTFCGPPACSNGTTKCKTERVRARRRSAPHVDLELNLHLVVERGNIGPLPFSDSKGQP